MLEMLYCKLYTGLITVILINDEYKNIELWIFSFIWYKIFFSSFSIYNYQPTNNYIRV